MKKEKLIKEFKKLSYSEREEIIKQADTWGAEETKKTYRRF